MDGGDLVLSKPPIGDPGDLRTFECALHEGDVRLRQSDTSSLDRLFRTLDARKKIGISGDVPNLVRIYREQTQESEARFELEDEKVTWFEIVLHTASVAQMDALRTLRKM